MKLRESRAYVVRVAVPTADFDVDSVSASSFYGPYTRTEVDAICAAVERVEGVHVVQHLLARSTLTFILQAAVAAAERAIED